MIGAKFAVGVRVPFFEGLGALIGESILYSLEELQVESRDPHIY